ncbi:hypothetical protein TNCT_264561 [Trichonephila clavata]|uniref:Uncharacterized protein n=1 Tax=Trichonephila clavata TaxID=2740835 RepID=A0A8X6KD05_TRICU|nr:hypothetical protein TNCT_264561 [Trichonephila clavata]
MTSSESESDDDMHLEQEERAATPLPPPPQIDHYKSLIITANYAIVCLNICLDLQDIIKQIDYYSFDEENEKMEYHKELHNLITEGHVVYKKLLKEEMNTGSNFFTGFEKDTAANNDNPSQSEVPFTIVRGRKKARSPTPPMDNSSKKLKSIEIETNNKFSELSISQSQMETDNTIIENEDDTTTETRHAARPPPPITIDNIQRSTELLKKLQELTKQQMKGRVIGKGLRVYPETPEAYHAVRNFIDQNKLESFT